MSVTYWLDLFTGETWKEFLEAGGTVSGFRESRWNTVSKMKQGDYLLCYLTGVSRWIGLLEITGNPYKDEKPVWSRETFPSRIPVKTIIKLTAETAVPVKELKDNLSYFQNLTSPNSWTGHFRGSPTQEKIGDAKVVIEALEKAEKNPVKRPVDEKKLYYQPKTYNAKNSEVTIPEKDDEDYTNNNDIYNDLVTHEEIQWLLPWIRPMGGQER